MNFKQDNPLWVDQQPSCRMGEARHEQQHVE